MKKILFLLIAILIITGCTQKYNTCNTNYCNEDVYYEQHAPQYSSYEIRHTVRKPVEVIYEDTTYRTVYTPRTYVSKRRVSRPYFKCRINGRNGYCK